MIIVTDEYNAIISIIKVGDIVLKENQKKFYVEKIPDNIFLNYEKWLYINGEYKENPDYSLLDKNFSETKSIKINESKDKLAKWLSEHPMQFSDGRFYSVTEEKQSLLNSNLASYERAVKAGISYPLKWNSTGDECVSWKYEDLVTLSLAIAAYVTPKVSKQQELELAIKACKTTEELESVVINYDQVE